MNQSLRKMNTSLISAVLSVWLVTAAPDAPSQAKAADQTTLQIQHLIVIIQENASFDHYFATYPIAANPPGEPAFTPLPGTPSINGLTPGLISRNPNSTKPFRLDRSRLLLCNPTPYYPFEQRAYHAGLLDRFPEFTGQTANTTPPCEFGLGIGVVMGYYDGNTVTALWNYAQNFAMSDNFFGTTYGQSAPGHINIISGQTHGVIVTQTVDDINTYVVEGTLYGDAGAAFDDCGRGTLVAMTGANVGDLLNAKGVTWGWFGGGFTPTSRNPDGTPVCSAGHTTITGVTVRDWYPGEPFQRYASTANPHHLPPTSVSMIGYSDQANHQYDLSSFWDASDAGHLPAVSFLRAPGFQNGHPTSSDALDEQDFLVNTINRLQTLPEWASTAVIITWDDSGGWYDHVMPPIVNQSSTTADALTGENSCGVAASGAYQGRCGYGPRLPLLVISPWAKVNFVDHSVTDQTSILRFIEDNWDLGRIGDQSFDEQAGSLVNLFEFGSPSAKKLFLNPATGEPIEGPRRGERRNVR
jgi:phospholipase C